MGKRLERVCDHLFWDVLVWEWNNSTGDLAQNVKWQVSCQLVEIPDSLYNFAKEVERRELAIKHKKINLDVWE